MVMPRVVLATMLITETVILLIGILLGGTAVPVVAGMLLLLLSLHVVGKKSAVAASSTKSSFAFESNQQLCPLSRVSIGIRAGMDSSPDRHCAKLIILATNSTLH